MITVLIEEDRQVFSYEVILKNEIFLVTLSIMRQVSYTQIAPSFSVKFFSIYIFLQYLSRLLKRPVCRNFRVKLYIPSVHTKICSKMNLNNLDSYMVPQFMKKLYQEIIF
jgi:hypothetical protein